MKSLMLIVFLALGVQAFGQSGSVTRSMARSGETVWICLDPIKKDKRADYERFLHDIFWAGMSKLSPADQKLMRQTRILHPIKAEADGTYSYFFVMDPVVKGGNYDLERVLTKMYGKAKATEYLNLSSTAHAREQVCYYETQSKD